MSGGAPRVVALTGGPGAGKTAILELARQALGPHVLVLPESASILFKGGFPREATEDARCAAQRAIFHVQVELEALFRAKAATRVLLCDRGTLDSLAYWPRAAASFYDELRTSEAEELARYDAVIHLEPPADRDGYQRDGVRIESAREAAAIDARIVAAWRHHPRRFSVPSTHRFADKAEKALALIEAELPPACRREAADLLRAG